MWQIKMNDGRRTRYKNPDSKIHGANTGPIWGLQDPGGPHVGPMNFPIWEVTIWEYPVDTIYLRFRTGIMKAT